MQVTLQVDAGVALELGEDFDLALYQAAAEHGVTDFDGGEARGKWYEYPVPGVGNPDAVADIVTAILDNADRPDLRVTVVRSKVKVTSTGTTWLKVLGSIEHPYDRAMREECKRVAALPEFATWFAHTGRTYLEIRESQGSGFTWWKITETNGLLVDARYDLSIYRTEKPPRDVVQAVARDHVAEVLRRTADYLKQPLPQAA